MRRAEVAEALDLFAQFAGFTPGTAGRHQRTNGHNDDRRSDDQEQEEKFIHDAVYSAGKRDGGKLIFPSSSLRKAMQWEKGSSILAI